MLSLQRACECVGLGFGPPLKPSLRKSSDKQPPADAVEANDSEGRAATIMEWKGGALRHCCRTFPPSPPHTGRARFRAPGVPNSILPGFSWSVISLMGLKVTCLAKSNCRPVLGLIGLYSRKKRPFPPKGCGVVYGCHRVFVTSFTDTISSVQGCQTGGKTASTLPVSRVEWHQVHRPVLTA